uniref:Pentraxin (PTX) domain-containing protein n=1 Tax=Monopterus albus TaxID=43700 RepID=A0A3Q3J8E3_MONAL|nr:pentraxin-related protein PTX3 [Monopterus albus]
MFRWRNLQAVCVLSLCVCLALAYEDVIEVDYTDSYGNEIPDGETPAPTPSPAPCSSPDLTKWDKIFSMLENSQMRENMLLQYVDNIIKVEMGSLRGDILRLVDQYGGSCGAAVETAGRRMASQLEDRLRETLMLLKLGDQASAAVASSESSFEDYNNLKETLYRLLIMGRTQVSRLTNLEASCFSSSGSGGSGHWAQKVTSQEVALEGALAALQQMRLEMGEVLRSSKQRYLPAGCEMALLFPMRSRRIYTSVIPDMPLSISSFTVCMWVKPTAVANKTVLFSYGNRRNPYEIQLLIGQNSVLFTVGGEAHLVEARSIVIPREWMHLCGAWFSEQGLASLWVGGKKVATTPGVAEEHVLPDGGTLQLGQERNGCCPLSRGSGSGMAGFEEGFDSKLAFAGKMTGVNMWDSVLSEEEISALALREGQGCEQRGNIVAWGVTEMVPHGGAEFIN